VCSYDRAGYGFSDPGPLPRDGAATARDLDEARVTHVGFSLSGSSGRVLVEHSCRAVLNGSCLHSMECVDAYSMCSNKGESATCICDDEHVNLIRALFLLMA